MSAIPPKTELLRLATKDASRKCNNGRR